MSNSRPVVEREDGLRSLRKFSETFLPYIMLIGAAMTWYANSASVTMVDSKFQESLKYTDKAVAAIQVESESRREAIRMELHREAEANKNELKDYSNANRQGMRIELKDALAEVSTKQATIDSKLDYLIDRTEDRPRPRRR